MKKIEIVKFKYKSFSVLFSLECRFSSEPVYDVQRYSGYLSTEKKKSLTGLHSFLNNQTLFKILRSADLIYLHF